MDLLEALGSGLGWFGDTINKPGRAVRGLLGGRPEEALALLPFSDSLGITDRANEITGKQLVGTDSDIGGMAVDIATDPLTYMGGALFKRLMRPPSKIIKPNYYDDAVERDYLGEMVSGWADEVPDPLKAKATPQPQVAGQLSDEIPDSDVFMLPVGKQGPVQKPPLETIGMPEDYAHLLSLEPPTGPYTRSDWSYNPMVYGPANDAVQEGLYRTAFDVQTGSWQSFIDDNLMRLSDEAIEEMKASSAWSQILADRRAELKAMRGLAPHLELPPDVLKRATRQLDQLAPFQGYNHSDANVPLMRLLDELEMGYIDPERGELAARLGYLGHYPINYDSLRRAAASSQRDRMSRLLMNDLESGYVRPHNPSFAEAADNWNHGYLAREFAPLIEPQHYISEGINPGIAREWFKNPTYSPDLPKLNMEGGVNQLLDELRRFIGQNRELVEMPTPEYNAFVDAFEGVNNVSLPAFLERYPFMASRLGG